MIIILQGGHRTPNRRDRGGGRGISESGGLGRRDNDCFGSGIEDLDLRDLEEFDFEKNLALFDKVLFHYNISNG